MSISSNKNLEESLPPSDLPRVIIVGGGFAGIELVQQLRKCSVETIMLDKNNYHTFVPLLYQVATAGLSPGDISSPLREFLQDDDHFHFRLAEVVSVDVSAQLVQTDLGSLKYDYLVLGTGSKTNFFGNKKIEALALKLREVNDALALRTKLINNFEKALFARDQQELSQYMNIVIVGAGPTGVELAGAIGELRDKILPKDYPELDFNQMKIHLIEGSDHVLNTMSNYASSKAQRYLEEFGVEVLKGTRVLDFDQDEVILDNGSKIPSKCLIWAAGVVGNVPIGFGSESLDRGRLAVDDFHEVKGVNHIYAIGDVAMQYVEGWDQGLPMLAPVAIQQANHLGVNMRRTLAGKEKTRFKYRDKGSMATIGRNRAVVDAPGVSFGGFFGWFVWMFIHLISIIGFRRKFMVFMGWIWNYLTFNRGNRLIIEPQKRESLVISEKDLSN